MRVNLLQGTSTPTLTPMPGVNSSFHLTAARWRLGMNPKGHDWAAAGDRQRYATRLLPYHSLKLAIDPGSRGVALRRLPEPLLLAIFRRAKGGRKGEAYAAI